MPATIHPWCVVTATLSGQPQQCVGHCQFCCFRPTPTTWLQQKWKLMMPPCPWGTCWLGGPHRKRSVTDTHTHRWCTCFLSQSLSLCFSPSLPHAHTLFTPPSPTHAVTCTLEVHTCIHERKGHTYMQNKQMPKFLMFSTYFDLMMIWEMSILCASDRFDFTWSLVRENILYAGSSCRQIMRRTSLVPSISSDGFVN